MLVGKEHIFKQRPLALCHSNFAKIDYFLQFSSRSCFLKRPPNQSFSTSEKPVGGTEFLASYTAASSVPNTSPGGIRRSRTPCLTTTVV